MSGIFHRPKLALEIARLLLRPTSLETRVRSGLFISGPRQTGKSTFLTQDVIPIIEAAGAVVIYVDLWKAAGRSPDDKLIRAIQKKLSELHGHRPQSVTDMARSFLTKIGLSSAEMEGPLSPRCISQNSQGRSCCSSQSSSASGTLSGQRITQGLSGFARASSNSHEDAARRWTHARRWLSAGLSEPYQLVPRGPPHFLSGASGHRVGSIS
jgi:hypothetical protein